MLQFRLASILLVRVRFWSPASHTADVSDIFSLGQPVKQAVFISRTYTYSIQDEGWHLTENFYQESGTIICNKNYYL